MVSHHSCSALEEIIFPVLLDHSPGAEVCVYLRGELLSRVRWTNTRELLLYLAVTFIHSQTADCIVHFIAVATTAPPFASPFSPSHSLSTRTHGRPLSLAHSHLRTWHAHTPHSPPYSWKGLCHSYNNSLSLKSLVLKYFWFPVSYVDHVCIVDKKATVSKLCRN